MHWQFFVDESGDFDEQPLGVVGGLLMSGYASFDITTALKHELLGRVPSAFYPPHANRRQARIAVVWNVLSGRLSPVPAVLESLSREFQARTRNASSDLYEEIVRTARSQPNLEQREAYERAVELDKALRQRAPGAWHLLDEERGRQNELLACVVRDLLSKRRSTSAVLAWSKPARELGQNADARYVATYASALERASLLVASSGSTTTLWVHLARRGWRDLQKGAALADAMHRAKATAERAHPGAKLRVVPVEVKYDATVHPGVVLADHFTNWVWRSLRPNRGLLDFEANTAVALGVGLHASWPGDRRGAASAPSLAEVAIESWLQRQFDDPRAVPTVTWRLADDELAEWRALLGSEAS